MAVRRPNKAGMRQVYAYDPATRTKRYVGSREKLADAHELERLKAQEFRDAFREGKKLVKPKTTCDEYAERWLKKKHGPGTSRPAPSTLAFNEERLRAFRKEFGERNIDNGIARDEALDWSLEHPNSAKTVSAMFNDAIDETKTTFNPFANRRQGQSRGRRDIEPLTEEEVETLYQLSLERWDGYGPTCGAWIIFSAWVMSRPGETARVNVRDLDFSNEQVTIQRIKPPYKKYPVVLPRRAIEAIEAMPVSQGLLFKSIQGQSLKKGSYRHYWDPVRSTFIAQLSTERRQELLSGGNDLDLYELRHFGASLMADRGADEYEIAHQLGNSPQVCRAIYIHSYRDRINGRNRELLNADVASLDEARARKRRAG